VVRKKKKLTIETPKKGNARASVGVAECHVFFTERPREHDELDGRTRKPQGGQQWLQTYKGGSARAGLIGRRDGGRVDQGDFKRGSVGHAEEEKP